MAIFTSLTRIGDYKHHWSDVLAGVLIGTTTAIIIVSQMFNCNNNKKLFKRVKCKD